MTRLAIALVITVTTVFAHCDSLDGPVVQAARRALAARNVNFVLPWVPPSSEGEVRSAFERARGPKRETQFFETVVRIHRAGEGAAYDGLKPEGFVTSPALAAADRAVTAKSLDPLAKVLGTRMSADLRQRFERVIAKSAYSDSDVEAGREYVKAYVDFIHYAEKLYGQAHEHHH